MSSDTDSTISSTSSSERKRKIQKKLKNKSEKKSKKHKKAKKSRKEKKRSRKESTTSNEDCVTQRTVKAIAMSRTIDPIKITTESSVVDLFGPALPPHLLNKTNTECNDVKTGGLVIGPTMPDDIEKYAQLVQDNEMVSITSELEISNKPEADEDLKGSYGPLPIAKESEMTTEQIELEKRALELKLAAIDGTSTDNVDQKVREEWMLELPEVGLKGGLAALNNLKRGFYQGKDKPDFSDRSSWTKTPQSGDDPQTKPGTSKPSREALQSHALALYEKQRDAEQEAMAKKHKKKHKRDQSLVDIHQKKLRKEEKRRAKELMERGEKPERRPFSRDIDLKLNKIDSNQTKQIVDKAKILNSKFSSGQAKYL